MVQGGSHESVITCELIKSSQANAIIDAIFNWAIDRHDVHAMALAGSWARSDPRLSDIDLLFLTDRTGEYRRRLKWLREIDFSKAGCRVHSGENSVYDVVWSRHIYLLPIAEVELTFANCSWARTEPNRQRNPERRERCFPSHFSTKMEPWPNSLTP